MTSIKRDAAARRRGELNRTSGGRRLSPAIDAPTAPERPATGSWRGQRKPRRSARASLREPDAFARLGPPPVRARRDRPRTECMRRARTMRDDYGL